MIEKGNPKAEEAYVGEATADPVAQEAVARLLNRDPTHADLYASAIELSKQATDESELAARLDDRRTRASQILSGASLLSALVNAKALDRILLLDGEPYDGSLEELQADDQVPIDAQLTCIVQATPAGLRAAEAFRESSGIEALFQEKPQYKTGFMAVLDTCRTSGGATTSDLQRALEGAGVLKPGLADSQTLHASFFAGKLECAGALVWNNRRWCITEQGIAALSY